MSQVVSVKFKDSGRAYYFDPAGADYKRGSKVIVETANGLAYGSITEEAHIIDDENIVGTLKNVLRLANESDLKRIEENTAKEKQAFEICEQKILNHKLEMKLVEVEYSFDGGKITFFFTADGRVDFRELVKDLAAHFHARIELRQIGVRDEARMLGGLGICGQPYCCKRFLDDFQPVSIKMAKEQGLSLNPTKISGSCGRLMCCLKYEQNSYEYLMSVTPQIGSTVKTPDGPATVVDVNLISRYLYVKPKDSEGIPYKISVNDVKPMGPRKNSPAKKSKNSED